MAAPLKLPSCVKDIKAIFSDIDGTIVHYEATLKKQGYALDTSEGVKDYTMVEEGGFCNFVHLETNTKIPVKRVPSLTLGGGFISVRTLELVKQLREEYGVVYSLLTGARTSTYRLRQDSGAVPCCDYGVCEGGGKLWKLDAGKAEAGDASPYTLDEERLKSFATATGDWNQDHLPANERVGPLWDCYRELEKDGYKLDAKSFGTAFMADLRKGRAGQQNEEALKNLGAFDAIAEEEQRIKELFAKQFTEQYGLSIVLNLGKGHVHPTGCNKRSAVEAILNKTGITLGESMAMFDDENDLEFAAACACGVIPGVAHPSVTDALEKLNSNSAECTWLRHKYDGFLATEAGLEAVLALKQQQAGQAKL